MQQIFKFFLLLGITGFGGPLSLVQLMRDEFVDKKKRMSQNDFDQVFTMVKAMPGPVAFQMAVYLGNRFYKLPGAFLAAIGLIFPSFLLMVLLGYFYESASKFIYMKYALNGFLYAVSAIILYSLKGMILNLYKSFLFWLIVLITFIASFLNLVPEPLLIIGMGVLTILIKNKTLYQKNYLLSAAFLLVDWPTLRSLFLACLYAGTFVFGTGLAILPFLRNQFVDQNHWLTMQMFNDGVIFGQMTPGPVTITVSFLGYQISGLLGATVATIGVFLMPFIHMTTWFPKAVNWLSKQKWIDAFLLGAVAAVIGSIIVTVVKMNLESYRTFMFWLTFGLTFYFLIYKPKIPLLVLMGVAGLLNLLVSFASQ